MILCLCRGVPESDVLDAIARGAATLEQISDVCGAGSDCRTCCDALLQLVAARCPRAYSPSELALGQLGRL